MSPAIADNDPNAQSVSDDADPLEIARELSARERHADALRHLFRAENLRPSDPAVHGALARLYLALGRTADALVADFAARALSGGSAAGFFELGTACLLGQRYAAAEKWLKWAVMLDPANDLARQNLAAALDGLDRPAAAKVQRDIAFGRNCLRVEDAENAIRTVLFIGAGGVANVPVETIFPRRDYRRIFWLVEYAQDGHSDLPPHDLVFNAVGEPELLIDGWDRLCRFAAASKRPFLNAPEPVFHTARHRLAARLSGIGNVVVPKTLRLEPGECSADVQFPVILRPVGVHGGKGSMRVEEPKGLLSGEPRYVTEYWETANPDGLYRKYRMIFIDRVPYAYHLAISNRWLVHYFSADMSSAPWKREEEHRFLADPEAALGRAAMKALHEIGERLDLDYAGIDFTLLPDGRVLVFEANPSMIIHLTDPIEQFPYKHEYVPRIFEAFRTMIESRCNPAAA